MNNAQLGLDPDTPSTGRITELMNSAANSEVAAKLAVFEGLYIAYPPHVALHSRFDFLRQLGVQTRGMPQKGLRVLAPSGSGKTSSVMAYIASLEAARPRTDVFVPALYVALERDTTPKKLMVSILQALGDPHATRGTEVALKGRAASYITRLQTEVLFLDEVQHLRLGAARASDATDALKGFLDGGVVPIVFLGIDGRHGALDLFTRNVQLSSRLLAPADLAALKRSSPEDRGLLKRFLDELTDQMIASGLQTQRGVLSHVFVRGCLHQVSKGVIGRVVRLMSVALEISLRREAEFIEVFDLAEATERWAIPQGLVSHNPFRQQGHE